MKKTLLTLFITVCASQINFAQPFAAVQIIDPNTGQEPNEIASGDLDGDGDIDLVMATYDAIGTQDYIKWYKNDGLGNFSIEPTVSSTILFVDGLIVADVDGQFGLDIVATSAIQNKLVYFLSDGAGGFGSEIAVDAALGGPGQVVSGDINNDGNVDLATMSYDTNKTVWYAGDGAGNFTMQSDIENGTNNGPYYIDLADFDGDGDLDALVGFYNTQSIEIYYNQYIESGTMTVSWIKDTVSVDTANGAIFNILFADANNDGVMDVVKSDISSNKGEVSWYNKTKNGPSVKTLINDMTIIDRPAVAYVVDLDNDSLNDVIVTDGSTVDDAIIFFKGAVNSNPSATPTLIANNNHILYDIEVADFDGDGDKDIAAVGNASDTVELYRNELVVLGISSSSLDAIKLYPNPTRSALNFKGLKTASSVLVFDNVGRRVLETTLALNESLDVSALNNGMYIIKFKENNSTYKFIKE